MTKTMLIKALRKLARGKDIEVAHSEADDLLIKFINDSDIKIAYERIPKWYA
jgi:hypothetical protein